MQIKAMRNPKFLLRYMAVIVAVLFVFQICASALVEAGSETRKRDRKSRGGGGSIGIGISIDVGKLLTSQPKKTKKKSTKRKSTSKKKSKSTKKTRKKAKTKTASSATVSVPDFLRREILISFPADTSDDTIDRIAQDYRLTQLASTIIDLVDLRLVRFRFSSRLSPERTLQLSNDPRMGAVQPNYVYVLAAETEIDYGAGKINASAAHQIGRGNGVIVAVIDSGIYAGHKALAAAVVEEMDAVGKDKKRGRVHGTAVASIIAAREGVNSVAPEVELLSVRAFVPRSKGRPALGNTYNLLRGIDWAVNSGAHILNLSFTGPHDPLLQKALRSSARLGVIAVAAAGNRGPKASPVFPAAYDEVIAVTATDVSNRLYKRSNQGDYIFIAAPGVDVLVARRKKGYGFMSGTSMAAAYVSGSIALMLEKAPRLSLSAINRQLARSAQDLGSEGRDAEFGHGLLDVYKALQFGADTGDLTQAN